MKRQELLLLAFSTAIISSSFAADGTWINNGSSTWTTSSNWADGPDAGTTGDIADGAGFTANFSTLNITADRTVTLGADRTIGNLIFGDTSGTQNWILTDGGTAGNDLTLDATTGAPTITVVNNTATINATITDAGNEGLTKLGAGTLILSQANAISGTTTIGSVNGANAGVLQLGNDGALNGTSATPVRVYGGELRIGAFNPEGVTLTLGGGSAGSNALVSIADNGRLDLGGNVTFDATNNANGALISGAGDARIDLNANRIFTIGDSSNAAVDLEISANVSNSGSGGGGTARTVTKEGAGTLRFSGANQYSGATTINAGTLEATTLNNGSAASSIGASSNIAANLVLNGGTLSYVGSSAASTNRGFTVGANGATIAANGTTASNTLTFASTGGALAYGANNEARALTFRGANAGDNTFAKTIGDNGSGKVTVNKSEGGKWVITGDNTYTGGTNVSAGTLSAGHVNAFGTGAINVTGGTLALNNLAVINEITLAGGKLTGTSSTSNVNVTGDAAVTGTYGGHFNAGTFASRAINTAGNVTVNGRLSGQGVFSGGQVTVNGEHAIGNSPGQQTFNDGLAYGAASTLEWEIVGNNLATAGTDYDQALVNGGVLSIAPGATLEILASGVDYTDSAWDVNRSFAVLLVGGTATFNGDGFILDVTGAGNTAGQGSWSLVSSGTGVNAVWTAAGVIPEPSVALLGGLSALALLRRRRND